MDIVCCHHHCKLNAPVNTNSDHVSGKDVVMPSMHMVKVSIVNDEPLGNITVDDVSHLSQAACPAKEDIAYLLWGHLALQDVSVVTIGLSLCNGGVNVWLHQIRVKQVARGARKSLQVQVGIKVVILWSVYTLK